MTEKRRARQAQTRPVTKKAGVSTPQSPHDNAEGYTNPRAWYHTWKELGQEQHIGELMRAIEKLVDERSNPRIFMAVALHHFLQLSPLKRDGAIHGYFTQQHWEWWALVDEQTLELIIDRDGEGEPDEYGVTPAELLRLRALRVREEHAKAYAAAMEKCYVR